MPEKFDNKTVFSLFEVSKSIENTISKRYQGSYWIKAEINKLNLYKHSGHCYPELVEKNDNTVVAQMRGIIWKSDFERINNNFIQVLKEPLKNGIKVLLLGKIIFDSTYGLGLRIVDIDPGYTLGDLEKEKQDAISLLKEQGVFDKNKLLKLPLLPQRIAVISVETSKGYADFKQITTFNEWGYAFFCVLFPSLLQGEKAIRTIISQLNNIRKVKHHFDVVVIVRGGGGDVGLSCYNNFDLAKTIALFPVPVVTGIGHATNETVVELVAYHNAITPTKLGEWLLQKFHDFAVPVQKAEEVVVKQSLKIIENEKLKLNMTFKLLRLGNKRVNYSHKTRIKMLANGIIKSADFFLKEKHFKLLSYTEKFQVNYFKNILKPYNHALNYSFENLLSVCRQAVKNETSSLGGVENSVKDMSPENVLKRGYSISLINGKTINKKQKIQKGDTLTTIASNITLKSTIVSLDKTNKI